MKFTAYIDGAARGNPGPAGCGVYVPPNGPQPAEEHYEALGRTTNNVAEYRALLRALERARELGAAEVRIFSDSLLLVEQMSGRFKVKAEHLKLLWQKAYLACKSFARFSIAHVPRERNREADRLANLGADLSEKGPSSGG